MCSMRSWKGNFDICTGIVSSRKNSTFYGGFFHKKNFPRLFRKMKKIEKLSVQISYKFPTNCKKSHENRTSGCKMVAVSFEGSFSWDTLYLFEWNFLKVKNYDNHYLDKFCVSFLIIFFYPFLGVLLLFQVFLGNSSYCQNIHVKIC